MSIYGLPKDILRMLFSFQFLDHTDLLNLMVSSKFVYQIICPSREASETILRQIFVLKKFKKLVDDYVFKKKGESLLNDEKKGIYIFSEDQSFFRGRPFKKILLNTETNKFHVCGSCLKLVENKGLHLCRYYPLSNMYDSVFVEGVPFEIKNCQMKCNYCDFKTFKWLPKERVDHEKKCGEEQVYCQGCEKSFIKKDMYHYGVFLHSRCFSTKNVICEICKIDLKSFSWSKEAFNEHCEDCQNRWEHNSLITPPCQYCKKKFEQSRMFYQLDGITAESIMKNLLFQKRKHEEKCGLYKRFCSSCKKTFMDKERHNFATCNGK